jgi:glycosyltransferase involved in cell wall biosynthesis
MATILMLDRGLAFGARTLEGQALGGAESAFTWLAWALAARGHQVSVRTLNAPVERLNSSGGGSLDWGPLDRPVSDPPDMVIANRRWQLFRLATRLAKGSAAAGKPLRVLWLHNTAEGLRRFKPWLALAWYKPILITTSAYHRDSIPRSLRHLPARIIPLAPAEAFRTVTPVEAIPGPKAIFTSNPVRGLDHLLTLWCERIQPLVPNAELHLFGGPQTYQAGKAKRAGGIMEQVIGRARGLSEAGVVVHGATARPALLEQLRGSRVMLYPGSREETYCLAAAEAQAAGVPVVLGDKGCLMERVVNGVTGFLVQDDDAFVAAALRLLTDDGLWALQHAAALDRQRQRSWDNVAAEFEGLL